MADSSIPRKPRKSNFSTDEVDVLVDSVRSHYNVLYGKFAKRATNRWIRQKAWLDILRKVNGVSIEKRTLQEVKNKWKKCQYVLKEKAASMMDDGDSSWEDVDSMPLQERLSKVVAQEKIAAGSQVLKSQPLSPTKLKVTRQNKPKAAEPPQSPVNEEMCLRWNSHHSNMQTAFPSILLKEQYVDVTLAAEGKTLKCHRLILSSCSPYFEEILSGISPFQHPVLFMRDIPFWILKSLCDFMYAGEVHIYQNKLEELLTVAEALKIKGLAGKSTPPEKQEEQQKPENNPNSTNNNNKEVKKKQPPQSLQHQQLQQLEREKEKVHRPTPPPLKKNPVFANSNNYESTSQDYDDDLLDPLDLLEPLYEEAAEEKKPSTIVKPKENKFQYQPIKKPFTRKLRKRKYSEQRDPSPPPVFSFRKGTRSRPNVKIPKYYHSDYSNLPKPNSNSQTDPLMDVEEIKTEPIDVEDNLIDYSDEENQYMANSIDSTNSPIIITNAKPPPAPNQDKFKKIKLSKPIITEVHTIEESNTTAGGLEVIKITMTQPEEPPEKKQQEESDDGGLDPLQAVVTVIENDGEDGSITSTTIARIDDDNDVEESEIVVTEETENVPNNDEGLDSQPEIEESPPVLEKEKVEETANNRIEEEETQQVEEPPELTDDIHIEDVRTACTDEDVDQITEEERRTTSLDHLEKEAMNVANAIIKENQADPPDIE